MGIFDKFTGRNSKQEPEPAINSRDQFREKYFNALTDYANWGENGLNNFLGHRSPTSKYGSLLGERYSRLQYESRKAYFSSPEAKALIDRLVENVVNRGMTLEASPLFDLLPGFPEGERKTWKQSVESRWKLWSKSESGDVRDLLNFNQLQRLAFLSLLKDGEFFVLLKYSTDKTLLNPLQFQILDPAQIDSSLTKSEESGNRIVEGIELDKNGKEVAYYVLDYDTNTTKRIERVGKRSKRVFMLHGFVQEFPGQVRGLPVLSGVVQELKKLSDFTVAEIQAAVINASVALWVKPSDDNRASQPFKGVAVRDNAKQQEEAQVITGPPTEGLFSEPGLVMQNLKAGEELHSYDTKRPNVNFDAFMNAVKKSLSSSLSIPIEILNMEFGSNYSASRSSIILFWNVVSTWRFELESYLLNPIYKMWLQNEVEMENIPGKEFISSPVSKEAMLNARWIGIAKPSIDPLKESKAVSQRLKDGLTTREMEAQQYNGTSFEENVEILKVENDTLAEALGPLLTEEEPPTAIENVD